MSKASVEILVRAKELVSDPKKFNPDVIACDQDGVSCSPSYEKAVAWCVVGAVSKTSADMVLSVSVDRYDAVCALHDVMSSIGPFAKKHTHAEVMAAWDRAIENEKERSCL